MRVLAIYFTLLYFSGFSQLENANWHFGNRCGLNFQNTAPIVVNSSINCSWSSTSISDSLGNLLFYVREGDLVYNKNHDTLANGQSIGFLGGAASFVIIRKSGTQYYIINNNEYYYNQPQPFPPMINYALVDMSLAAGLGSVIAMNQPITAPSVPMVSKVAATKHCNDKDHWLMCHVGGFPGSIQYRAYLVSSIGISTVPVISTVGSIQYQSNAVYGYPGQHKFSPNCRKFAACMPDRTVELYDFNPATGQLSNVIKLDSLTVPTSTSVITEQSTRSLEFSPDGSKLYVSYVNQHPLVCQFDLSLSTASAIAASKTAIDTQTLGPTGLFRLQLAPNGKIYVANGNLYTLGAINFPNSPGLSCNYQPIAVYIGTTATAPHNAYVTGGCLPSFMTYNLEKKPVLPSPSGIVCGVVNFLLPTLYPLAGYSVSSYYWNFNDPLSGANTSTLSNPSHTFSANGTYTVKLALNYYPCGTDTLKQVVTITGLPVVSVTGKTTICKGESTVLNFSGANGYTLNTTAIPQNTAQVQPTITTVYTVTAKDNSSGCSSLKTLTVNVLPCVGLRENNLLGGLKLYPNPNRGVFTFITPEACEVKIHNSLGQEVYRASLSLGVSVLDISREAKGLYLLEWNTKEAKGQFKILFE